MKNFFGLFNKKQTDSKDHFNKTKEVEYAEKFLDLSVFAIDFERIPKHIAIVMDGNGRWAKDKGFPRSIGHRNGVMSVDKVVEACKEIGVQYLSVYAFSTENWKRPEDEVNTLMQLLVEFAQSKLEKICRNNVKVIILGDLNGLPSYAKDALSNLMFKTAGNTGMILNLCINYGSRWEIVEAAKKIAVEVENGHLRIEDISENLFSGYLSTKDMPDPELMIRTSGEQRLSNFLLWQLAYAELYFTDIYWPDFREKELLKAIYYYQNRDRRFGGI
jgi:undecaprenyl diphosphate synthase